MNGVSAVEEIYQRIESLSVEQRCELLRLINPLSEDDDAWESQMRRDSSAGRLGFVRQEVEQEAASGKLISTDEVFGENPQ